MGPWLFHPCDIHPTVICTIDCVLGERLVAYGGDKMTTKDGLLCSNWSMAPEDNTIKDHVFDEGYTIVDVANHCRNPNKDVKSGPYCFVDGKLESCDVPICDGEFGLKD